MHLAASFFNKCTHSSILITVPSPILTRDIYIFPIITIPPLGPKGENKIRYKRPTGQIKRYVSSHQAGSTQTVRRSRRFILRRTRFPTPRVPEELIKALVPSPSDN
ncbi:hypothetical protein AVEN_97816-1 [Araneus ventricosus]|uniref:Uncharacterized protein n=1 Tax=Araneus ventricosus TaxID=182803 RepID=A0A4Y2K6W8_ARAVE|nr:hypothetical protein AVEN_97816-1 [Araneus ventricosus]